MEHTPPESQHDPHNAHTSDVRRIRMSWIVIVLIVTAIAVAAVMIMLRSR